MLSALGNDELGISALRKLSDCKVTSEYVSVLNDSPTGCCMVTLNEQSVPEYDLSQNVAYDHIPFKTISDNFDLLYFGTLALRSDDNLAVLKRLIRGNYFSEIMVDINIRAPFSSRASVQFSVKNATLLKNSAEELPIVAEFLGISHLTNYIDFSMELAKQYNNLKCIIITLGVTVLMH